MAARVRREQVYQQALQAQGAELGQRVQSVAENALGLVQQHEEGVRGHLDEHGAALQVLREASEQGLRSHGSAPCPYNWL